MVVSKLLLENIIDIAEFHCVETIRYSLYNDKTTAHDSALSDYEYLSDLRKALFPD